MISLQDPSGEAASQAQKHLTYYELDLGLNHVLRKWSEPIDNGANLLVPVPGGGDGPGGVLVCADNFIIYRDEAHEEVLIFTKWLWHPKNAMQNCVVERQPRRPARVRRQLHHLPQRGARGGMLLSDF